MNYSKIKWYDISNGPGVRASLFVSGCTHHCKGCFNEVTWDFNNGDKWTKEVEDKFISHLQNPDIVGVNILGGEPLQQGETMFNLITRIKKEVKKPIWLWTGYIIDKEILGKENLDDNSLKVKIMELCDVVVEGRFIESKKDLSLKYRGSTNQRVIDIKKSIKKADLACRCNTLIPEYIVKLEGC